MTHTPGPWRIERHDPYQIVAGPISDPINVLYLMGALDGEDVEADKHLLLAAPDLLVACKATVPCLEDWIVTTGFGAVNSRDRKVLELLNLAIAKAEGEI